MRITPIRKQDRLESRPHTDRDSVSSIRRPSDAIGDTLVTCAGDARLIEAAASEDAPDNLSRRTAFVTALPTRSAPPRGGAVGARCRGSTTASPRCRIRAESTPDGTIFGRF